MIEGLFKLNSLEMLKLLEKVEEEMLEDSYSDEAYAIETIAKNAKEYIKAVFDFMKIHYKEESCNVLHANQVLAILLFYLEYPLRVERMQKEYMILSIFGMKMVFSNLHSDINR